MGMYDPAYKEYLRVGKLAGSLQREEEQVFDHLMETDEAFRQSFTELSQTLTPAYLEQLQKYRDAEQWPSVDELAPPGAIIRRLNLVKVAVAAGILLAIGLIVPALLKRDGKMEKRELAGIELELSNGNRINLSEATGDIPADAVTLQNSGNRLTYNLKAPGVTGMNTLSVAPGMDYQVTLADGSQVWLNSTSTLEFPFSFNGATREIRIKGEALLKIAKNREQPFIVHLPGSSVLVTGTEFNVNTFDSGTVKVALLEGSVMLTGGNNKLALQPGRQGVYENGKALYDQPFNQRNTLGWTAGLYYFEKSRLEEIVQVISRWYGVKVVIDNARNQEKQFVGVLNKKKPLRDFLNTLEYVADIRAYKDADSVLHFR